MKIRQVSVKGLFGIFDHVVPFSSDDRITILLGQNGFGKTIILRMIEGVINRRYGIFNRVPFGVFEIKFDNGQFIRITKEEDKSSAPEKKHKLVLQGPYTNNDAFNMSTQNTKSIMYALRTLETSIPDITRIENRLWINRATGETLTVDDMTELYERFYGPINTENSHDTPDWVEEIQKTINIRFIQTNRLSINASGKINRQTGTPRPGLSVDEYSQELAAKIRDALTKSAEISSSLDSTFPNRLMLSISKNAEPPFSEEQLRKELRDLEIKRLNLKAAGLLDRDIADVQIPDQKVDRFTLNALSIYVEDAKDKLRVFDDLLARIDLFRDIIRRRFRYKSLSVSKQEGFVFRTEYNKIPLDALSSGEQHEVVLLYELLFKVKPNSLILLDEPEISLHIAWQQEFLKDLLQITEVSEFDVLIATHSPDIINDRWDLTVELQGPNDEASAEV